MRTLATVVVAVGAVALLTGGCSMFRKAPPAVAATETAAAPAAPAATPAPVAAVEAPAPKPAAPAAAAAPATAPVVAAAATPAKPAAPDWTRARTVTIVLAEGAMAPAETILEAGTPVRIEIRNTRRTGQTVSAGDLFRQGTVRTAVAGPTRRDHTPVGFKGVEMEALAYHAVNNLNRMTPHEMDVAAATKNPFDDAPAPPTPIDFGALLGNLGANPFGAPSATPAAGGFPDIAAMGAPEPKPAPAAPADAAFAALAMAPAPEAGLEPEKELPLLAGWSANRTLSSVSVEPGESVFITFLPTTPGTYRLGASGGLFGTSATVLVVAKGELPPSTEAARPAANLSLLGKEANPPEAK